VELSNPHVQFLYLVQVLQYKDGDRLQTWQELMQDLELYVKKVQITQSMTENNVEKIPSANIFSQLVKLVRL